MLRFTAPWFLVAIPLLWAGLWWSWKHVHGMAKPRKRLAFAVRSILVGLIVTALAGPQATRDNKGVATMFVVDRSDSVSDVDRQMADDFVKRALAGLRPDDVGGVVAFGAEPVLDSACAGRRSFSGIQSKVDGSSSDLAAALRLAAATLPQGKAQRIVVLSDGNETKGDAAQAAEVASSEKIPIDTVSLGTKQRRAEVAVVDLKTPNESRADEPFMTRVTVESTVRQQATLVIDRDGAVVSRQPVLLEPGKSTFSIEQKLGSAGFYRYRATIEAPEDTDVRNNFGSSFTVVRGKPKILILQGDKSKTELATALTEQGIDVVLHGPESIPVTADELQAYDAVILNDLNAQFLASAQMKLLQAAVRDTGIGLAMVGGENSFLPGGWYGTPVAEALPVDLNIRQRKTFPSTTVLIVIDASGSMGMQEDGVMKIELAGRAAEETVKMLSPLDRVGVAGSSDGIELVAPIQELKDKPAVISQIKKLRPGAGGIYCEPSVQFAMQKLEAADTKVRHFLLLADGDDVDSHGNSLAMVAAMAAEKITTSVVAIGDGKDVAFLRELAAIGGGRFYLAKSAGKLPAILTQDVALMSRSAIEEMVFVPELRPGEEILRGFTASGFPALYAYCLADARPLARVGLVSPKRDPILATWQYGLGTSIAFTSDAQARWASRWVGWEGFGRFWAQAARSMSRKSTKNDYELNVSQVAGKGEVKLKASDRLGNPVSATDTTVRVSGPMGNAIEVQLTQEAPGVFTGSFPATDLGSYIVSVAENSASGQRRVSASGFSVPYPPEYRSYRTNTALMNTLASLTGGAALVRPDEAFRPVKRLGVSLTDLWQSFCLAAALLLPFDIAIRRLAIPFAEMLAALWVRLRRRKGGLEPVPTPTLARLQEAKNRVSPGTDAQESVHPLRTPKEQVPRPVATPTARPSKHTSAATRLLEERRRRQDSDKP